MEKHKNLLNECAAIQRIYITRGIDIETLKQYKVGMDYSMLKNRPNQFCLTFAQYLFNNYSQTVMPTKFKYRALNTKLFKQEPSGTLHGLFGLSGLYDNNNNCNNENNIINGSKPITDTIVVTEGEYDAMAIFQGLKNNNNGKKINAVSLPNGTNFSSTSRFIDEISKFENIWLWFDWDQVGQKSLIEMIQCIKSKTPNCNIRAIDKPFFDKKCLRLHDSLNNHLENIKDANDVLRLGEQGQEMFDKLFKDLH